jgi:hypothetical protein
VKSEDTVDLMLGGDTLRSGWELSCSELLGVWPLPSLVLHQSPKGMWARPAGSWHQRGLCATTLGFSPPHSSGVRRHTKQWRESPDFSGCWPDCHREGNRKKRENASSPFLDQAAHIVQGAATDPSGEMQSWASCDSCSPGPATLTWK